MIREVGEGEYEDRAAVLIDNAKTESDDERQIQTSAYSTSKGHTCIRIELYRVKLEV